ncbi:hypothetical protein CYMTET_46420 [Cymbomonas tetramitiformis]|uniref:Metallo-beta-lactamase domain-containing protein n=1 Tax=Cymbomonas tetramitiformis TaxID=36881 RepID=A0AAE0EX35_9CHLO|nr:hypothetical protein CYMTET_46420 [Cymbomonas tetramitiformis]
MANADTYVASFFGSSRYFLHAQLATWQNWFFTPAVKLTKLGPYDYLSPVVIRVLGGNPGAFTLQGTNTYIIGSGTERIIIDTGEGATGYHDNLLAALKEHHVSSITDILLTHWHPDHTGGVHSIRRTFPAARVWKRARPGGEDQYDRNGPFQNIEDGQCFATSGATLRALFSPGHADDHMSFILEEEGNAFSGDNVLGEGTSVFEDFHQYMASLQRLRDCKPRLIYPSHGPVIEDAMDRVDAYIKHRMDREAQILKAMQDAPGDDFTIREVTAKVYEGYPYFAQLAAAHNTNSQMQKLCKDGKIMLSCEAGLFTGILHLF